MKIDITTIFKGVFLAFTLLIIITQTTDADLSDIEVITDNIFTSTTLDFSNRDTANDQIGLSLFNISGFLPGGFQVRSLRVKKDGELTFKYHLSAAKTLGDDTFCNVLDLVVMQNYQIKYQGKLPNLNMDVTLTDKGYDDWVFFLNLNNRESNLMSKTCDFNLVFRTWRETPGDTGGFFDEETAASHVFSGTWSD